MFKSGYDDCEVCPAIMRNGPTSKDYDNVVIISCMDCSKCVWSRKMNVKIHPRYGIDNHIGSDLRCTYPRIGSPLIMRYTPSDYY